MLVGPGRGSSAGSLLCYLIGITEVDPIPHGLLFERFIDLTRKDLPDIDIDFADTKRDLVFDYLGEKYGANNVARLGNINTLKPKSVLAAACKRFDIPDKAKFDLVNVLEEHSSGSSLYGHGLQHALETTEPGRRFRENYPEALVMTQTENHASHTGVHAAGVIVCNVPVNEFCTIGPDGVAHIDKPDSEALNLLKIDALGLRTLGIIEDSGMVTAEQLYALKLDDPEVFGVFNSHKFCGIFQFEGQAQRTVSAQVHIDSFQSIDHITALSRPGPLGGGAAQKYINRAAGREAVVATHPRMQEMLQDTFGVVLYQEQVMRIVREIGKFSWEDTTVIRKAMSGRKGEEFFNKQGVKFIAGAAEDGIDEHLANAIWLELCSFGAWGMNKSHTCAYSVISYWCAWMKRYHPLEYAAACLRSAKDDDQTMEILREMAREGVAYVPFDIDLSDVNWSVQDGKLVGGFMNLVGFGPAKSVKAVEDRAAGKLNREKVERAVVKFAELYPLHAEYADWYNDPESKGCRAGSRILQASELPENGGDCLFLGKIDSKKLRDKNESVLVKRREGKVMRGPTQFADFVVKDDTGIPIICRIDRFEFEEFGRKAIENLVAGEDVVLIRGDRIPGFSMIKVKRMMCLNRSDAL
jgi:DNA polymerase III alpha subunit